MTRLLTLAAGRRAKWIVLVLWLCPLIALGSYSAKFNNVQKNAPSNFTPKGAESTQVDELQRTVFPGGKRATAIVVFHRAAGLTLQDMAYFRADIAHFKGPHRPPAAEPPVPGRESADGKIVTFTMAIASSDALEIQRTVDNIRQYIGTGANGLDIRVTGPAGILVDAVKVFSSISGVVLAATLVLVLVLLLLIYRSPIIALIPLFTVGAAYSVAAAILYFLATDAGLTVNGQSGGILPVLMFGAGTDYALLLIARYREELCRHDDRHEAMAAALRGVSSAILSSGVTVVAAMLVLLLATLRSTQNLGPVLAIGVGSALLAGLTLLPAILQLVGRRAFWPFVPKAADVPSHEHGLWHAVGSIVAQRPGLVAAGSVVLLLGLAFGATAARENLNLINGFVVSTQSAEGFRYLQASEPAGVLSPTNIVVRPASVLPTVQHAASTVPGVALAAYPPLAGANGYVQASVIFADDPYGSAALDRLLALRRAVHAVAPAGATVLVGGETAITRDTQDAANNDLHVIAPVILVVILVILCVLLRALIAPLYLIATVVLSFFASLGVSVFCFQHFFGFEGIDAGFPTLLFLFLVALGVDYNIFLVTRIREEAARFGTREGALRGLAATGGIITSAGLILAGTFAVLISLPLKQLVEFGFAVAFGVVLDTALVRAILVPALVMKVGPFSWWPSTLRRGDSLET